MTEAPRDWSSPAVDEQPHPQPVGAQATPPAALATGELSRQEVTKAWMPWVILSVFVFLWGIPQVKAALDAIWAPKLPVAGLHNLVQKVPPVVAKAHAEAAVYNLNLLSATGTGILLAAIISGFLLGYGPGGIARMYGRTLYLVRYSMITIAFMLALGLRDPLLRDGRDARAWPWPTPVGSIRCLAPSLAGSGWRSRARIRPRTCCSAACSALRPSSSVSVPS